MPHKENLKEPRDPRRVNTFCVLVDWLGQVFRFLFMPRNTDMDFQVWKRNFMVTEGWLIKIN